MANLYRWLNQRHHDKLVKKMSRPVNPKDAVTLHHHTWEEMEARWAALEARQAAQPRLVKAARRVRIYLFGFNGLVKVRMRPRYIVNHIVWYHQRARRGWADSDTWNIDSHITRVLSGMLAHLAEHNHAYPAQPPFETPEKWDAHLRDLSARLRAGEDDDVLGDEAQEIVRAAMGEFAGRLSWYWD